MVDDKSLFEKNLAKVVENRLDFCQSFQSVERLSGGASQETYCIRITSKDGNELKLALRRAAGGLRAEPVAGYPGLATEALLMQCARRVGVPEPEVYWVLKDEDGLGEGFIMEWLDGEALGARINRSAEFDQIRPSLAYECGKILAQIHNIDLKETGLDQKLDVISPEEFVRQTWERYQLLNTPQPMIDYSARWLLDHLPTHFENALVHNDFRNGNFMVTANGIVAVLDWELAHIGDCMRDLGWICTNSWRFGGEGIVGGFGKSADLFKGYEEVSGKAVDPDHVKFWEVFGSFWWSVGCLGMAEHYRTGPDKTVERPAIGRRSSECQVDCVNLLIPGAVELNSVKAIESTLDMPRMDELLVSVRDFLRADVMAGTQGRLNFMARVASNSLDIVLRETSLGPPARKKELEQIEKLFSKTQSNSDDLEVLRWDLVHQLRDKSMPLDNPLLHTYLRHTVVNQIAIDQPKYSGLHTAIRNSE